MRKQKYSYSVILDDAIFSLCEENGTRMGTTEKKGSENWVIGNIYDLTILKKLSTETNLTNFVKFQETVQM